MMLFGLFWVLSQTLPQLREMKRLPGAQRTISQSSVFFWYLFFFFPLINDLIIPQSNFTLPTVFSTNVGTPAASVLSTNSGVSGASASQFVFLATFVQPQGSSKFTYTAEQTESANALRIPSELHRTGTSLTLQQHYACYLAYLKALTVLRKAQRDGTWPEGLRIPGESDVRLLFGKSTWHDGWSKTFPHLREHPKIKKWLADDEDCLDNVDLWGSNLKTYHFPELVLWLKQGGSLKKGGKKAAASTSGPSTLKSAAKASTKKSTASAKKAPAKKAPAKKASTSKTGNSKGK
jgi:hypothetical protein